jgi:hypothetical protein
MNTNELKRFAREARIKLHDQVGRKLEYVITSDTAELRGMSNQISDLRTQINKIGKEQVIEKVAYTWFNRLMALRFMDANGYNTPMVVTPIAGYLMPQVLQEAKACNIEESLQLDRKRLNDLLDGKTQVADAQTEAYKLLLIASCNALNSVMPFMFERISDYTELLLPDDLLSDYSIITDVRSGMTEEDCKQEELIGWLYQFYIADKKDEVFSDLKKNVKITAENIPAATQLFTPRWIVRYMVENTLGKLWLTLKPNSKLKERMPYYIEAPEGNELTPLPEGVKGVTDIKFLDPCQGSGHVLVYAFDLLAKIYEEEGYNTNEIPGLILENNLFGIDIDERAAQLAAFALTMKGRNYYPRFLRKPVKPNVIALENIDLETIEQTIKLPIAVGEKIINDHDELSLFLLTKAKNFGSLIQIDPEELKILTIEKGSIWEVQQEKLQTEAIFLANKYHCVVTNPPYMGNGGMNEILKNYVEVYYKKTKNDLMVAFMNRSEDFLFSEGYMGMINFASWMFLSSFEDYRLQMLNSIQIESLLHNGRGIFGSDFGTVSFVFRKTKGEKNKGVYRRLFSRQVEVRTVEKIKNLFQNKEFGLFITNQDKFIKLPGYPIGYWVTENFFKLFESKNKINGYFDSGGRCKTHNEKKYVRKVWEVSQKNINIKWRYFENGGDARLWYGNITDLVDWSPDALKYYKEKGGLTREEFWHREGITWNMITYQVTFRYKLNNSEYSSGAPSIFIKKNINDQISIEYALAYFNSIIVSEMLKVINPTVNTSVGVVLCMPFIISKSRNVMESLAKENIEIAKIEWNSKETSIDFQCNNLIEENQRNSECLEYLLKKVIKSKLETFNITRLNEEKINALFINELQLDGEFISKVPLKNITLFQNESKIDGEEIQFDNYQILVQFISYSIGCIFGRYSIDKQGLILGNQGAAIEDFFLHIPNPTFIPDKDNIIPVLEAEYFSDDIVGKFIEFVKIALCDESLLENLKFIENIIGKEIRKYFAKDFYADHLKRYKKRPIYWMFSSPKGHFKALIYLHRYRADTISTMLNDYLRVYIGKLESEQQSLNQTSISESASAREQTLATKRIAEIEVMLKDLKIYERTLFDYAAKKIEIDLDDGVKVNYLKFKEILVPIKGLDKDEE